MRYYFQLKIILLILAYLLPIICISQFITIGKAVPEVLPDSNTLIAGKTKCDTFYIRKNVDSTAFEKPVEMSSTKYFLPLKKIIYTSNFGIRMYPVTGKKKAHYGVDLKANYEQVYAIADGYVVKAGTGINEGNYIVILHGEIESVYCHLSEIFGCTGQYIKGGECVGISGNTGLSTGPHLHFGMKYNGIAINPKLYLDNIRN